MEPTLNTPPPYEPEDLIRLTNNFNNLQHFTQYQNDMLLYRSDYHIFDNSWRIWKLLERTKCQLRANITWTQLTIEHTKQQQWFLMAKANWYYHILYTPEIQRRINKPETVGQFLHPNTLTLCLQPLSPLLFISTEEISSPTIEPIILKPNTTNERSHTPPSIIPQNQFFHRCQWCQSTRHQKWDCPRYQCLRYFKCKPGYYTHKCPTTNDGGSQENLIDINDYNYNYDPNGNLDHER